MSFQLSAPLNTAAIAISRISSSKCSRFRSTRGSRNSAKYFRGFSISPSHLAKRLPHIAIYMRRPWRFASIHSISWLPDTRCEPCPNEDPTPLAARCLLNRSMLYRQSFASRFTITSSLGSSQRGGQNYVFNRIQFQARTSLGTSPDCNSRRGKDTAHQEVLGPAGRWNCGGDLCASQRQNRGRHHDLWRDRGFSAGARSQ